MQKSTLIPVVTAIVLVALIGGGYALYATGTWVKLNPWAGGSGGVTYVSPTPLSGAINPEELDAPAQIPDGYIPYTNARYGFSFSHAPEAKIKEYDEGRGAMTITLENFQKVRGMQIFIVPYAEKTITDQRFHDDVPSGVRNNIAKTFVDGVEAVTFTSKDAMLGDTREVWFIHGGYLFEVTTFAGVTNWFTPIMQSWKFL